MNKEQLTEEKVREIDSLTYQLKIIAEDKRVYTEPLTNYSIHSINVSPLRLYDEIIQRHGLGDLYEIFRLLLFSAMSKREDELKAELTSVVNEKQSSEKKTI